MIEIVERDDERSVVSPTSRLIFRRDGKRWSHAIEVAGFGSFAESVEADPSRDDPRRVVSPTYQELHFERRGHAVLALLVGQYGPHHFSAAIRVEEHEGDGPPGMSLLVDAADRCRSEVHALAATYVARTPIGMLRAATDRDISWDLRSAEVKLGVGGEGGSTVSLAESAGSASLAQIVAGIVPGRATHRLIYRWTVAACRASDG
jgi:hypothetical protein